MTRIRHYDHLGTARFVTLSCYHNYNLFKTHYAILTFVRHFKRIREVYNLKLLAYVIMPNHVHLVLLPPTEIKLGRIIGELKSLTAKEILAIVGQEPCAPDILEEGNKVDISNAVYYITSCPN